MPRFWVWILLVCLFDGVTCVTLHAVTQPAPATAGIKPVPTCQAVFTPGETCARRETAPCPDSAVTADQPVCSTRVESCSDPAQTNVLVTSAALCGTPVTHAGIDPLCNASWVDWWEDPTRSKSQDEMCAMIAESCGRDVLAAYCPTTPQFNELTPVTDPLKRD